MHLKSLISNKTVPSGGYGAGITDQLLIEQKTGPHDLVSQADREVEDAVRAVVARHRPADGVFGEEGGESAGSSGIYWVVDPIDGTLSYLYGKADWTVSVAAARSSDRQDAGVGGWSTLCCPGFDTYGGEAAPLARWRSWPASLDVLAASRAVWEPLRALLAEVYGD